MPDTIEASVTIDSETRASWSIQVSSGNMDTSVGQLRDEVMAFYGSVIQNDQGVVVGEEEEEAEENLQGTKVVFGTTCMCISIYLIISV